MSHTGKNNSIDKIKIEVDKTKKSIIHAIQKYGSCYSDQNKGCRRLSNLIANENWTLR